ncbi:MAG: YdbH domain-containing protein [Caulobacteraceae bacterium]|nr:YdbH domain-containing protein [Caulobacteraceae bacterium]
MTDQTDTQPPKTQAPRARPRRRIRVIFVGAVTVIVAASAGIYLLRRQIGAELAREYLSSRGVESAIAIQSLTLHGFSGRLRLGPEADPDAAADQVDVDLTIAPPWSSQPFQVVAHRIRLVRPSLKMAIGPDGELSLGGLDRLIKGAKPSAKPTPLPDIVIEDGRARLATMVGDLVLHGGGQIEGGQLVTLDLRSDPANLRALDWTARVGEAALTLRTSGRALLADLNAPIEQLNGPGARLSKAKIRLHFSGETAGQTALSAHGRLSGQVAVGEAVLDAGSAKGVRAALDLPDFQIASGQAGLSLRGGGGLDAGAASLTRADLGLGGASAHLDVDRFEASQANGHWTGSANLTGSAKLTTATAPMEKMNVRWSQATADWRGTARLAPEGLTAQLSGKLGARGALPPADATRLGQAASGGDAALAKAISAALTDFHLSAPSLSLAATPGAARLTLGAPLTATTVSGAKLSLASLGRGPLAQIGKAGATGAFAASANGGGLPSLDLQAARYTLAKGALDAQVAVKAALSLGPVRQGRLDASGRVRADSSGLRFDPSGCASLGADRLELGTNSVDAASGRLCPARTAPLIQTGPNGWRLNGRFEDAGGASPGNKVRAEHGAGSIEAAGGPRRPMSAALSLTRADITDTEKSLRFNPVRLSGPVSLDKDVWRGRLAIVTPKDQPVGIVELRHANATGEGQALISTPDLRFAKGGLQPIDLTPLAEPIRAAEGQVAFNGEIGWTKQGSASRGEVSTEGLDVVSAAGAVTRIKTDTHFTSLIPLVAAPGQVITAQKLDSVTPLEAIRIVFDLDAERFGIQSGRLTAAGGEISIEPVRFPLAADHTVHGVVVLSGVNLGQMIAASNLADKVRLDAVVDGRLPFEIGPDGFKLINGGLVAVRPGRLEIQREVLTGVGAPPPNAIQDFAYQALANLAFDTLEAKVETRPGGRLGVVFHIKGRYDPAVGKEAFVELRSLADGSAFQKSIPLPKGTPIDLTLDTSLNFTQLLGDYQAALALGRVQMRAPARSGAVQPPPR